MHPRPLVFVPFHEPRPPNPDRKDERNESRAELRDCFDGGLVAKTGRLDARLRYAVRLYATEVVHALGYKFNDDPGWPPDIPFRDLNRIPGGKAVYHRLLSDWHSGRLRFVQATDEDKRNALLNPWLVFPNPAERAAALRVSIPRAPSVNLAHRITDFASRFELPAPPSPPTTGLVLHPATMRPQFTFSVLPESAQDAANMFGASGAPAPKRARAQRSDINKSRKRPVTNPEGRELRHPKRGPMTAKGVVEPEGIAAYEIGRAVECGEILLTDEVLTDCVEVGRGAGGSRSGQEPASEDEIESMNEIEPAARAGPPRRLRM